MKYHERLANKLNDPETAPKTHWAILKTFTNGSKIPRRIYSIISLLNNALSYLMTAQFLDVQIVKLGKEFHLWNFVLTILLRLLDQ